MRWLATFDAPGFHDVIPFEADTEAEAQDKADDYSKTSWRNWPYMRFRRGQGTIKVELIK